MVGNAAALELKFQQAGLVIAAVENGKVSIAKAFGCQLELQVVHQPVQLIVGTDATLNPDSFPYTQLTPERLFKNVVVVGDHGICCCQDAAGGAVVLFQLDDFQVGEVFL